MPFPRFWMAAATTTAALLCVTPVFAQVAYRPDKARVAEIAATLPQHPAGAGKPASDRTFWRAIAGEPFLKDAVKTADDWKKAALPQLTDSLYLEFSKNGNRRNYENVAFNRRNRLAPLVLAECAKSTGEYLPALNELIDALCSTKTWVLPAHDKGLTNYNGTLITIDLFSSNLAWELAQTDYLLGEKLKPPTREALRREVNRRVVMPFQEMIQNKRKDDYWFKTKNNWNPVCLSGCTGAALIQLESAQERAEIIVAAEHYVKNFLDGFTSDGYCSEGVGYWNYGYGRFALMGVNFRHATAGKVDLFAMPGAAEPAAYGARISIINGVVPAFADCALNARPSEPLLNLLNRVYGWNDKEYAGNPAVKKTGDMISGALLLLEARTNPAKPIRGADISGAAGLRTVFDEAQVFICRPGEAGAQRFGVAFKGGNNAEHHNHNDLGSYVVVVGDRPILLDPGPETYTRRTFSGQRYDSKLLNSYGHSVPVVAGKLQEKGSKAQAVILDKSFSDTTDTVTLDIKSAYDVPGLKTLTRKFEYGRRAGILIITDHVKFDKPEPFETALISLEKFSGSSESQFETRNGKAAVRINVTSTAPLARSQDQIEETAPVKPYRLALKLAQPATEATIQTVIQPAN